MASGTTNRVNYGKWSESDWEDLWLTPDELAEKYTGTADRWADFFGNKFHRRMDSSYADRDDLRARARFGLVKAAHAWERERGVKFLTCANYWVREYVKKEVDKVSGKRGNHYHGTDFETIYEIREDDAVLEDATEDTDFVATLHYGDPLLSEAAELVAAGCSIGEAAAQLGIPFYPLLQQLDHAVHYSGSGLYPNGSEQ